MAIDKDKLLGFGVPDESLLVNPYNGGGKIHIKPSKRGTFTAAAKQHGKSVQAFASQVLAHKENYSPAMVKKANFARNAAKWHADGGPLDNTIDYTGINTTNHRKYNPDYISYIDTSLANADISQAKRASILANIIEESGGDPFALDSTGKFYGLLQWADDRYKVSGEKDPYKEIDNQVTHILNTLGNTTDKVSWTHGGTGSGYNSYKDAMTDFDSDDLATAMKGFTLGYVRPTGKMDSYNNRLKVAEQLLDRYNGVPLAKAKTIFGRLMKAYGGDIDRISSIVHSYAGGGDKKKREPSQEGGYTSGNWYRDWLSTMVDPAGGFGLDSRIMYPTNKSRGEENEYWRAYLGLDNNVPKMSPGSKTEWDDKIEEEKVANGELPSQFYGTTPRMDQMIQVLADTLNVGNLIRNYDEYKKAVPSLADKEVLEHVYAEGKKVMDNPDKWTQVIEGPQFQLYSTILDDTNEYMPLGMLKNFGMKWSPEEETLHVHDTYDFQDDSVFAAKFIPKRPREMKIRGKVNFSPSRGSVLLRDGLDKNKVALPIATKKTREY